MRDRKSLIALALVAIVGVVATGSSSARTTSHRGGTLKLLANAAGGTLDPQVNYTLQYWQLYQATYDGLLAFQKAGGSAAFNVVPDLASKYTIANGGKSWVFTLRKGIKFSNGQPVTANDVVASFRRIFKVKSPTAGGFYSGIVGASKCLKTPATCTLAGGISGKGNTVTINLTAPDAEFKYKLAVPHASILPASAPPNDAGSKPIPGTGAYYFSSYDSNKQLVMKRNPYFHVWSQAAQPDGYPDQITQSFGLTVEAQVTAVENGQADWGYDFPPADRLNELGTKYAAQTHLTPLTAFWYAPMNVNIPPFTSLKARQAVNYAIDRNALIKIFGGPKLATPSCQVLPPGFPGNKPYCPYTKNPGTAWTAPDVAKAKQLVNESGQKGAKVVVISANDEVQKAVGVYLASVLNEIGFKATAKAISGNIAFTYPQNTKNHVQINVQQWYQDYPAASDFLHILFGCESFHPGSDSSINMAGFCNKPINAQMNQALKLENTNFPKANSMWAKIDREVTDQAPMATMFTPKHLDFVSKRVGNFVFSKQFYWLVDQSWVQ
ncbi:MAG TPA: ABC transporter substrate-binding protein [Gaiellaceae bacterium]|jgi:peptide/nickel transport system substrate-binding protein|nr:ABC transporter substrate-binding protein [Gaiellaceae bacterium]